MALAVTMTIAGCAPTPNTVTIINDLDSQVTVILCSSNDCDQVYDDATYSLQVDDAVPVSVSSRGVPSVYQVIGNRDIRLGCLPIVMPEPAEDVVVLTSQHVPCVNEIDESVPWPSDQ